MDILNGYGEMNPVSMYDSELENWLDECKTEEERNNAIKEYVSMKLKTLCIACLVLFISMLIIVGIIYLFK